MDRNDKGRKAPADPKEAKLAAALRANLRRRKAPARAPKPADRPEPDAD